MLTRSGRVPFDGMQAVATLDEARALAAAEGVRELCVIGGAELYALTLPFAARLSLTHVDTIVDDADTFFPAFDHAQWRVVERESHATDDRHAFAFEFVDYERA